MVSVAGGGVQFVTTMTFENSEVPSATVVQAPSEYAVAVATIESPAGCWPAKVVLMPNALPAMQALTMKVLPSPAASASKNSKRMLPAAVADESMLLLMVCCRGRRAGGSQRGRVLQIVRAGVGVAGDVRRRAVVAEVDAEQTVVMDGVVEDAVAGSGCR